MGAAENSSIEWPGGIDPGYLLCWTEGQCREGETVHGGLWNPVRAWLGKE